MEHSAYEIDLLDENGKVVGHKPRRDIDKLMDIYYSVYVLLVTPEGRVVLTPIMDRQDLPNLYINTFGVPVATIRRHGENAEQAAVRAVHRELFIEDPQVHFVSEGPETLADGRKRYSSLFYLIGDPPTTFSKTDISKLVTFTPVELSRQLKQHPEEFAPTFRVLWEKYQGQLPI